MEWTGAKRRANVVGAMAHGHTPAEALYAWIVEEADGSEGIIATIIPTLGMEASPLVTSQRRIADLLRPLALAHGKGVGRPVKLVKYDAAEVLELVA